jgi:hypothetical protein
MTTVVISQPMYLPWPGFLAQLSLADVVVWLNDAQFSKGSFTNRVQVNLPQGKSWLSIPLEHKGSGKKITELVAAKPDWLAGHVATLKQSLRGSAHLQEALEVVLNLRRFDNLCDALVASSTDLANRCGISPKTSFLSSDLNVSKRGSDRVLQIVKMLGGTRYVTGHGARNYLNHSAFQHEGIDVEYMNYNIKPWGFAENDFSPFVTGLDLLANVGSAQAATHLNPSTLHWQEFLEK